MNRSLHRALVSGTGTLMEAMEAINSGGHAIAFVTAERGKVVGTLTDGDVRRAILAGASLTTRCLRKTMNRRFAFASPRTPRVEVLDMMRARGINQVPVLDRTGRLVSLHLMHDLIGGAERPNWAVIMAGGKGERLRPLTLTVPKPMLPVAGRPILERLVLHLVGAGIRRIFISVNYLAEVIEKHFRDGERFGCRIEYLREATPLGTGGALSLLPERPRDPVLTLNGDLVTQVDVSRMLEAHAAGRFAVTVGTRSHEVHVPFGVVTAKGGRLVALQEKPSERVLINAGVYVVSPRAARLVPKGRDYPITALVESCLRRRWPVGAFFIEEDWVDVGRPDELRKARGDG